MTESWDGSWLSCGKTLPIPSSQGVPRSASQSSLPKFRTRGSPTVFFTVRRRGWASFYPFGDEWHFTDSAGKRALARVNGNLVTTSVDVLRETALSGRGLLLLPPFLIREELKAGSLVPLLLDYPTIEFSIVALYPHRRHLAAKVRVFIDALVTWFAHQQLLTA